MFCSGCGHAMQSFEQACPKCGRPVPPMPLARPLMYSRVQRHIQTVAILWMVWASWSVIGWLIALPFVAGAFGGWGVWGTVITAITLSDRGFPSAYDVAAGVYHSAGFRTGNAGFHHGNRIAAPRSLGANAGSRDRISYLD